MREGSIGRRRVDRLAIVFIARRSSLPGGPLAVLFPASMLHLSATTLRRNAWTHANHTATRFIRRLRITASHGSIHRSIDESLRRSIPALRPLGVWSPPVVIHEHQPVASWISTRTRAKPWNPRGARKPKGTPGCGRWKVCPASATRDDKAAPRQQPVNQHLAASRVRQARVCCKKSTMIRARLTLAGRKSGQTPFTDVRSSGFLSLSLSLSLCFSLELALWSNLRIHPDFVFTLNNWAAESSHLERDHTWNWRTDVRESAIFRLTQLARDDSQRMDRWYRWWRYGGADRSIGRTVSLFWFGGGSGWMCQSAGLRRNERKARLRSATAWHRRLHDERESCALSTHPRRYIQPPAHGLLLLSPLWTVLRARRRVLPEERGGAYNADTGCAPPSPNHRAGSSSAFADRNFSPTCDVQHATTERNAYGWMERPREEREWASVGLFGQVSAQREKEREREREREFQEWRWIFKLLGRWGAMGIQVDSERGKWSRWRDFFLRFESPVWSWSCSREVYACTHLDGKMFFSFFLSFCSRT